MKVLEYIEKRIEKIDHDLKTKEFSRHLLRHDLHIRREELLAVREQIKQELLDSIQVEMRDRASLASFHESA